MGDCLNNISGCGDNLTHLLCKYIGQTVTIFTKSGGQSGSGFTGVILGVNECFVRLITSIGPAPGCALGNACGCTGNDMGGNNGMGGNYGMGGMVGCNPGYGMNNNMNYPVYNVGSVTDIPICSIASFVHNAI